MTRTPAIHLTIPSIPLPAIVGVSIFLFIVLLGAAWIYGAERAERREAREALDQPVVEWPATGQAMQHFFGTDEVEYDPEADAAVYREKAERDFMGHLSELREMMRDD